MAAIKSRICRVALLVLAAIVLSGRGAGMADEPPSGCDVKPQARMKSKTSDQPRRKFVRGPAVQPKTEFIAWLEGHILNAGRRHIRVPLVLKQGQVGFSLQGARIGSAADAIEVYADDSALGIGLANHALTQCKGRKTCAFWVEGRLAWEEGGAFRLDVMKFNSAIAPEALPAADYIEVEDLTIPEPTDPEQGFPLPKGALRNERLGGATSLAPGRNYILKVYEVDSEMETIASFYDSHLPGAKRSSEGQEVTFSTPRGSVKLARISHGTRITLAIGPQ